VTLTAAPPAVAADLVLVRLIVPSKKPPVPGVVRTDVGKLLFGRELTADEFAAIREDLVATGLLTTEHRKSVRLTDAGRARALTFLGVSDLPPRTTWQAVRGKYLFARAAGISTEAAERLDKGEKVGAFLVKRAYGLPAGAGTTMKQVMQALVCSKLGRPEEVTWNGLIEAVLSELVGADGRLTKDQLESQLPRRLTKARDGKADTLRAAVIREWLSGPSTEPPVAEPESPAEFDLPAFAETVKALGRTSPPEDRFGGNKVFIAAVWRASQREPGFPRLDLPEFKSRLIEANREGLLNLSRADLVEVMDPARVTESETHNLNATFHFVLVEGDQP
jgi:hypothetical protein